MRFFLKRVYYKEDIRIINFIQEIKYINMIIVIIIVDRNHMVSF